MKMSNNGAVCTNFLRQLQHLKNLPAPEETQANQFAARILAPACVLHALKVRNAEEIARLCGISRQAAEFRLARLRVLEQRGKYFTSPLERQVYEQFIPFLEAHSRR